MLWRTLHYYKGNVAPSSVLPGTVLLLAADSPSALPPRGQLGEALVSAGDYATSVSDPYLLLAPGNAPVVTTYQKMAINIVRMSHKHGKVMMV
jgi:hypothetical protein